MSNKKVIGCISLTVVLILLLIRVVFLFEGLETNQRVSILSAMILCAIITGLLIDVVDACFIDEDDLDD